MGNNKKNDGMSMKNAKTSIAREKNSSQEEEVEWFTKKKFLEDTSGAWRLLSRGLDVGCGVKNYLESFECAPGGECRL